MDNLLIYMIKVSIGTTLLYLCYLLFFNRDTFYLRNRIFLVLVLLIPILVPAIRIPIISHNPIVTGNSESFDNLVLPITSSKANLAPVAKGSFDFIKLAFVIYFSISAIFVIRCVISVLSTFRIIRSGSLKDARFPKVIVTDFKVSPFSFFPYVVIPKDVADNDNYKDVLEHEIAHVKQGHTFDLLLSEILIALQWFNPFVWFIKRSIVLNHEYLADHLSIKRHTDIKEYQLRLLGFNTSLKASPLAHNFNNVVKNRIIMINKKPTSRLSTLKNFIILPFVAFITYTSASPDLQNSGKKVSGFVLNKYGKYLSGVEIYVTDQKSTNTTDNMGHFVLNNVPENAKITFKAKNYDPQTVAPVYTSELVIRLPINIPEQQLKENYKEYFPARNSNPLIVIDGSVEDGLSMADIDPTNGVTSIKIISDQEASKKYGEKAKNGVIEINTETGSTSKRVKSPAMDSPEFKAKTLVLVDGNVYKGNVNDIPAQNIQKLSVRNYNASDAKYGEKDKEKVLEITTK